MANIWHNQLRVKKEILISDGYWLCCRWKIKHIALWDTVVHRVCFGYMPHILSFSMYHAGIPWVCILYIWNRNKCSMLFCFVWAEVASSGSRTAARGAGWSGGAGDGSHIGSCGVSRRQDWGNQTAPCSPCPTDRCLIKHEALQSTPLMFFPFALKQEMLNKSRAVDTGIKMEVNERSGWPSHVLFIEIMFSWLLS